MFQASGSEVFRPEEVQSRAQQQKLCRVDQISTGSVENSFAVHSQFLPPAEIFGWSGRAWHAVKIEATEGGVPSPSCRFELGCVFQVPPVSERQT